MSPIPVHQEMLISPRLKNEDARDLVQKIANFCKAYSNKYKFLRKESEEYGALPRVPPGGIMFLDSCIIHRHDLEPFPVLAFASGDGGTLYLANIVPKEGIFDVDLYNFFATEFYHEFKKFTSANVKIRITKPVADLNDIIPGKKTRTFFEIYLNQHPTSFHGHDIRRLDNFICALFHFSRGRLNCARLERYLVLELGWKREHAKWCCDRIMLGMDILSAWKSFY